MSPMVQQFLAVALPIMITFVATIWIATWAQNKRLDDIVRRLERIESKLGGHDSRIATLEERTSPLARR